MKSSVRTTRVACNCGDDHWALFPPIVGAECVDWTGSLNRDGYGYLSHKSQTWMAHRLAYFAAYGEIPRGLVVDHLCKNRACVNPSHLEAVTDRVNILRSTGIAATNVAKTTCKLGHQLSAMPSGRGRYCLTCAGIYGAKRRRETRLAPDDPRHGTTNGYANLGCRCPECKRANAVAHLAYMTSRRAANR